MDGELISAAESKRLEKMADEILKADAQKEMNPANRKDRSGMTLYREKYGLLASGYQKYEKTGFSEEQLENLTHGIGEQEDE